MFGRGRGLTVKTLGIMVRDTASLIIGSDDCRHDDHVNIVIQGKFFPRIVDLKLTLFRQKAFKVGVWVTLCKHVVAKQRDTCRTIPQFPVFTKLRLCRSYIVSAAVAV